MLIPLGWALIGVSVLAAVIARTIDRRLEEFRRAEATSDSWFVPTRFRRDVYRLEGWYLVQWAWRAIGAMYGFAFAGALMLIVGYTRK